MGKNSLKTRLWDRHCVELALGTLQCHVADSLFYFDDIQGTVAISSQATLAAVKVTNSPNSDLNFVKTFTWFLFKKKYFARINFDETRAEKRS